MILEAKFGGNLQKVGSKTLKSNSSKNSKMKLASGIRTRIGGFKFDFENEVRNGTWS